MKNREVLPKLNFISKPPHTLRSDYIESKNFSKLTREYPNLDVARENEPFANLQLLRIELYEIERQLRQKREHFVSGRGNLDEQWNQLEEKEKQLRETLICFDSFIQDNELKRVRVEKKLTKHADLIAQRQKDIINLQEKIADITKMKTLTDQKLKEYNIYQKYLQEVVDYSSEFKSIQDVIDRYVALLDAKQKLAEIQEENCRKLENAKSVMMKSIESKRNVIMGLNSRVADLEARFEIATRRSMDGENLVLRVKDHTMNRLSEIYEVKLSIWNLYTKMASFKKQAIEIGRDDVDAQCMYIKTTFSELSKIVYLMKKRNKSQKLKNLNENRDS